MGELYSFPVRYRDNFLCGCSVPFQSCPFWSLICLQLQERGWDLQLTCDRLYKTKTYLDNGRNFFKTFFTGSEHVSQNKKEEYIRFYKDLYDLLLKTNEGRILVDSSKNILHFLLISEIKTFKTKNILMVRDPRAVAFSWNHIKKRTDNDGIDPHLPKFSVSHSALRWLLSHLLANKHLKRSTRLIYEKFASAPQFILDILIESLEIEEGSLIESRLQHTIGGNPGRMAATDNIKVDDRWKQEMPFAKKLIVTCLTLPFIFKFYNKISW